MLLGAVSARIRLQDNRPELCVHSCHVHLHTQRAIIAIMLSIYFLIYIYRADHIEY